MVEKASKSQSELNTPGAGDLARALAQAGAVQDLAKYIAQINAPTDALKKISAGLSLGNEITKSHQAATDIAKALSHYNVLSDLTKNIALPLPRVNLNLPDMSRTIQASLPRLLPEPGSLGPREGSAKIVNDPKTEPNVSTADLAGVEVTSPEDLGLLIRRAREKRNLSQQRFADLAGVGRRFVSELENGKATLELGKVLKVTRAAGISIFVRNPR
ncbi:helix-turn-helix transcriptional regulator [Mesorhizobium sp. M0312]|uniref:helix-turn-helix transcriptional regulator n=1 Tax=unclassified Mesorhizobium TaxID=325217 RepID=UPI003334B584